MPTSYLQLLIAGLDHVVDDALGEAVFFEIDDVSSAQIEGGVGDIDLVDDHVVAEASAGHFFDIGD